MKDRIRKIMESQHMSQHSFAQYLGLSSAAISGIYNGRTKPSLTTVETIHSKFPQVSMEWLMFGTGPMMNGENADAQVASGSAPETEASLTLDFTQESTPTPEQQKTSFSKGVNNTPKNFVQNEVKIFNKPQRKITEIRVYFDDQTYETFVPRK